MMSFLTTAEAARALNVSPTTLRAWEQRYAFPASVQSIDGRRRFDSEDVMALRAALESGHSIAQAGEQARRGTPKNQRPRIRRASR
jgi:DNA-binding transcriptional MerR regulator